MARSSVVAAWPNRSGYGRPLLRAAGLVVIATLPFAGTLGVFFVQDDFGYLEWVARQPLTFVLDPTTGLIFYRPFTPIFLATMRWFFGLDPVPYKAVVLALHAVNALLLWRVAATLTGHRAVAWAAAVFWAVHPAHFVPIFWLSAMHDVAMTTAVLLSILGYVRWASGWGARCLAVGAFALGLGTKEPVVMYPFVLLALEGVRLVGTRAGVRVRAAGVRLVPFFALDALYLALRFGPAGGNIVPADSSYALAPWGTHVLANLGRYAGWLVEWAVAPWGTYSPSWSLAALATSLVPWTVGAVAAAGWAAAGDGGRRVPLGRWAAFGALWASLGLLPVLFLRRQAYAYYLSAALPGAALAVASGLGRLGAAMRAPRGPGAALLGAYALLGAWVPALHQQPEALAQTRGPNLAATLLERAAFARGALRQLTALEPVLPPGACVVLAGVPASTLIGLGEASAGLHVWYGDRTLGLYGEGADWSTCAPARTFVFRYEGGTLVRERRP
jgi:hypothetical protein